MQDEEYEIKSHHLIPGTLLKERYEVGRVIGEVGFGITYAGRDTLLDMKYQNYLRHEERIVENNTENIFFINA